MTVSVPPPTSPPGLLAVYGSLMRAEGMLAELGAQSFLRFVGPARLPGRLYDLGEFPGLVLDDPFHGHRVPSAAPDPGAAPGLVNPAVPGELFAILDARALALLDEYEGCPAAEAPPGSLAAVEGFIRQPVRLIDPRVEAWVYLYRGSTNGYPPVVGISWPEYKSARSRA